MYWEALELANLETLFDQSQVQLQTTKMIQDICNNPYYQLHKFLPDLYRVLKQTCLKTTLPGHIVTYYMIFSMFLNNSMDRYGRLGRVLAAKPIRLCINTYRRSRQPAKMNTNRITLESFVVYLSVNDCNSKPNKMKRKFKDFSRTLTVFL